MAATNAPLTTMSDAGCGQARADVLSARVPLSIATPCAAMPTAASTSSHHPAGWRNSTATRRAYAAATMVAPRAVRESGLVIRRARLALRPPPPPTLGAQEYIVHGPHRQVRDRRRETVCP